LVQVMIMIFSFEGFRTNTSAEIVGPLAGIKSIPLTCQSVRPVSGSLKYTTYLTEWVITPKIA
jgi:hypothetical protein